MMGGRTAEGLGTYGTSASVDNLIKGEGVGNSTIHAASGRGGDGLPDGLLLFLPAEGVV